MDKNQALKLYIVLSRAYRTVSEADKKEIRKYGLSPSEFGVLELLFHKGPQPIQLIASKILLTSGSMTYVVSQLEKKGFIKRVVFEKDRRIIHAELTNAGNTLIGEIFPAHEKFIYNMFRVLEEEDTDNLMNQLKLLGKSITDKNHSKKRKE